MCDAVSRLYMFSLKLDGSNETMPQRILTAPGGHSLGSRQIGRLPQRDSRGVVCSVFLAKVCCHAKVVFVVCVLCVS